MPLCKFDLLQLGLYATPRCLLTTGPASYISVEVSASHRQPLQNDLSAALSGFSLYCPHIRVGCASETLLDVVVLHCPKEKKTIRGAVVKRALQYAG